MLVPELWMGDVAIRDNLSIHKRLRIVELIEAAGTRLVYLSIYSPELIFTKVKQLLRSLASELATRFGIRCSPSSIRSPPKTP